MNEHDTRLWRVLHYWVEQARARADYADVSVAIRASAPMMISAFPPCRG